MATWWHPTRRLGERSVSISPGQWYMAACGQTAPHQVASGLHLQTSLFNLFLTLSQQAQIQAELTTTPNTPLLP